jgi:hypothetical protein
LLIGGAVVSLKITSLIHSLPVSGPLFPVFVATTLNLGQNRDGLGDKIKTKGQGLFFRSSIMPANFAKMVAAALSIALLLPATLFAQGLPGGGGGGNGGGFGGGFNNFNGNAVGGVSIDSAGVLSNATQKIDSETLGKIRSALEQAKTDYTDAAQLRFVSLKGLESAYNAALESGKEIPSDILFLAGLQKIEYVIASPETHDVILGGPAEGLTVNGQGRVVGANSGRPPLRIDDLMVAMKTADNARTGQGISVSIDPTEQGNRNLRQVYQQIQRFHPSMQKSIEQAMGPQVVSLTGVPQDSRFAHVLAAADYKMKRLSMGLDPAPIKNFPSLLEIAQQARAKRMSSAPRFWMECDYEPLAKSEDNLVWQIKKSGVKTLTEDNRYGADGKAVQTGKQNRLAKQWADMMTERYDELADAEPVFRDLQNLMDLSVVAAIIKKYDMTSHVGLTLNTLSGENEKISLSVGPAPQSVATVCTFVRITNNWLVSTSGGVQIDSWAAVENTEVDSSLSELSATATSQSTQRWWWNAVN